MKKERGTLLEKGARFVWPCGELEVEGALDSGEDFVFFSEAVDDTGYNGR